MKNQAVKKEGTLSYIAKNYPKEVYISPTINVKKMNMRIKHILSISIVLYNLLATTIATCQTYPMFGPEKEVAITGLIFDAMEPFISPNGEYLFFNNLNDGVNTKLYYASKVNDSTFTYVGELIGANQVTPPYLDAVADLDSLANFYWTSTRDYPAELNNLFHGTFNKGSISNIGRVGGDFNMNTPGWLVMDHGISLDGQFLYFNNARFDDTNCQGPCETIIGIAQKVNDSTFNTLPNSSVILQTINDANYKFYAPCISSDNLELYYTRFPSGTITSTTQFEICVAVRNSPIDNFSAPIVLFAEVIGELIEAPTLTVDKQIMYYHKKTANSHKIVMRFRKIATGVSHYQTGNPNISIFPNPTDNGATIKFHQEGKYEIIVFDDLGRRIKSYYGGPDKLKINIKSLQEGLYFIQIFEESRLIASKKLVVK